MYFLSSVLPIVRVILIDGRCDSQKTARRIGLRENEVTNSNTVSFYACTHCYPSTLNSVSVFVPN